MSARPHGSQARGSSVALALLAVVVSVLATVPGSAAAATIAMSETPTTYSGFSYGSVRTGNATDDKPQSKLWWADGSWWSLMVRPQDSNVQIFRLQPDHTWQATGVVVDDRPDSTGDALWVAGKLYVASRQAASPLRVIRFSYDSMTQQYSPDPGFPVTVNGGGSESAAIARDSTGRLWITYTRSKKVWVAHTLTSDTSWSAPFVPPVADTDISADDISSIVSFAGQVGVMWSNQLSGAFRFAVHRDGAPVGEWTLETALSGAGMADDHINLKTLATDSSGRVHAAIKTGQDAVASVVPGDPLVMLLTRSSTGTWSSAVAGTVADKHTRPLVVLDETNQELYFLATRAGQIVYKRTGLAELAFSPGRGSVFMGKSSISLNSASGSKQPVNATSGMVGLASSATDNAYYHAEMAIRQPDVSAPSEPGDVAALAESSSSVRLSWSASADDVGVIGYRVFRDGSQVAELAGNAVLDEGLASDTTYEYAVAALDAAGNVSARSAPVAVRTLPPDLQPPTAPGELVASAEDSSSVRLQWTPGTDDVGVVAYRIFRDGAQVAEQAGTSLTDRGVTSETTYGYHVVSVDAAGNVSEPSSAVVVTTPAPQVIVHRAATAGGNSTGTSLVLGLPAGTLPGDLLLASLDVRGRPSIKPPSGWTLVRRDEAGSTMTKATYYRVATSAESDTWTWTFSTSRGAAGTVSGYAGVKVSQPVQSAAGQVNGRSKTIAGPSVSVTRGALVLGLFGQAAATSLTPPTLFTERAEITGGGDGDKVTSAGADRRYDAAGDTGALLATSSVSAVSVAQTVALQPAD